MRRNVLETVMGAVVLVVAGIFMVFAYSTADLGAVSGYRMTAKFDRVDGLSEGTDVRVSGIKIGTVTKQSLDPETFLAVIEMTIDPSVKLPTDTAARVISDGLLGGKYLALEPGGDEKIIQPGGTIEYTQSSVSIEDLVGQLIFSNQKAAGSGDKK